MGNTYDKYADQLKGARGITQGQLDTTNKQVGSANDYAAQFNDYFRSQQANRDILAGQYGSFNPQEMIDYAKGDIPVDVGSVEGYSPEALTAMRGAAIDQVPGRYDDAMRQLKLQALRRGGGGGMAPGYLPGYASILNAREGERAGALRGILVGNEQQKLTNLQNARQFALGKGQLALGNKQAALGGMTNAYGLKGDMYRNLLAAYDPTAAMGGVNTMMGNANSALGVGANLAQTYGSQVQQPKTADMQGGSFWKNLLASGVGAGMNFLTGGVSGLARGGGGFLQAGLGNLNP